MHRIAATCCFALLACTTPTETETEPATPAANAATPAGADCILPPADGQVYGMMQTREGLTLQLEPSSCRKTSDVTFGVEGGVLGDIDVAASCHTDRASGNMLHFAWSELPSFDEFNLYIAPSRVARPGSKAGPSEVPEGAAYEHLYGLVIKDEGIEVRVASGGCTAPEHFAFYVDPGSVQELLIVRTTPDTCEAELPEGELLHFTWEQLGVTSERVRVANPFRKLSLA